MSITAETAQEHAKDPAVLCCRAEAGTVLSASNLEDPNIFPDLEDSGLLTIPDNVLHIGNVIGATMKVTADSLVPLTPDMLEGITEMEEDAPAEAAAVEETAADAPVAVAPAAAAPAAVASVAAVGGSVRIHIGEGKDIDLEFPLGGGIAAPVAAAPAVAAAAGAPSEF